jgi:hypothetical protein
MQGNGQPRSAWFAIGSGHSGDQGRDNKMPSNVLDMAHFAEGAVHK